MLKHRRSKKDKNYISHKIEIYPDEYVKKLLHLNFGYARYLYNLGIQWREQLVKESLSRIGKFPPLGSLDFSYLFYSSERPKQEFELTNQQLIHSIKASVGFQLYQSFDRYLQNPKENNPPKFRSKKNYRSFTISINNTSAGYDVRIIGNELIFPKTHTTNQFGIKYFGHCKISEFPRFQGKPISATFSEYAGHYYVSFTYELDKSPYSKTNSTRKIGIDLGVKTFLVGATSDQHKITVENQNSMKKLIGLRKRVRFYQSKMDKSYKKNKCKTQNYFRWYKKFRQTWKRICDIKRDLLHKITTELTQNFGVIKIEDLRVKEMLSTNQKINKSMRREITFSCFSMFRNMLTYKSKLRGVKLQIVDRYFPSSQLCCRCGYRKSMSLKERVYECPQCGLKLDRDLNAAINILKETERVETIVSPK